jgi:hypothetical protein
MLTVVTGPPAAGKSTHVRTHAQPGDVIIDFDTLAVALGSPHPHNHPPAITAVARAAWMAASRAAQTARTNTWLIHALPSPQSLAIYRKAGAHIIEIDPGEHVVRQRITATRTPQAQQWADQWYATGAHKA